MPSGAGGRHPVLRGKDHRVPGADPEVASGGWERLFSLATNTCSHDCSRLSTVFVHQFGTNVRTVAPRRRRSSSRPRTRFPGAGRRARAPCPGRDPLAPPARDRRCPDEPVPFAIGRERWDTGCDTPKLVRRVYKWREVRTLRTCIGARDGAWQWRMRPGLGGGIALPFHHRHRVDTTMVPRHQTPVMTRCIRVSTPVRPAPGWKRRGRLPASIDRRGFL